MCIISFISIFATGMLVNMENGYDFLFILPSFFLLLTMLSYSCIRKHFNNVGFVIVLAGLFIKNSLTPLIMVIGEMATLFPSSVEKYILPAIGLMIYEQVACFLCMHSSSAYKVRPYKISLSGRHTRKDNKWYKRIIYIIFFVGILIWILTPEVHEVYRGLFSFLSEGNKDNTYIYTDFVQEGSIDRIISTLFTFGFSIMRIVLPAYWIVCLAKHKCKKNYYLSILIAFLQFLFIPEAVATVLINTALLILLILEFYPEYKKRLLVFGVCGGLILTIIVFSFSYSAESSWYNFDNIWQYLSNFLNCYFGGVVNVANTYNLPHMNGILILFNTLIGALPFRSTWLPCSNDWLTIDMLYHELPRSGGQIIPTIGSGRYMLTGIFAPLFSIIFFIVAAKFGEMFRNATNKWKKIAYLYMSIQFALGLSMYNIPITMIHWMQVGIPLLIISSLAPEEVHEGDELNEKCNR